MQAGGRYLAQVGIGETSESEPPMICRNRIVDVRTGGGGRSGINASGALKPGLRGVRLHGGVNPIQALVRNVRTCRLDAKEPVRGGGPGEDPCSDARHRGRVARSRVEGAVMALDRRGGDILSVYEVNRKREEPRVADEAV